MLVFSNGLCVTDAFQTERILVLLPAMVCCAEGYCSTPSWPFPCSIFTIKTGVVMLWIVILQVCHSPGARQEVGAPGQRWALGFGEGLSLPWCCWGSPGLLEELLCCWSSCRATELGREFPFQLFPPSLSFLARRDLNWNSLKNPWILRHWGQTLPCLGNGFNASWFGLERTLKIL